MPLLPALGLLDAVPDCDSLPPFVVASSALGVALESVAVVLDSASVVVDAEEEEVSGWECCMMVLLTANLYLGGESGVEVSEIRDLRMVFWAEVSGSPFAEAGAGEEGEEGGARLW